MILLIILLSGIGAFAKNIYLPAFPLMAESLHVSTFAIRSSFSIYLVGVGLSQLIYGVLLDRYRSFSIVYIGITIFILGSVVCVLANSAESLLAGRLLQGIGIGVAGIFSRYIRLRHYKGASLSTANTYSSYSFGIANMVVPFIGAGLITYFNWQSNFLFLAVLGLIVLILSYYFLQKTTWEENPTQFTIAQLSKNIITIMLQREFLLGALANTFVSNVSVLFFIAAPFIFQVHLHLTPVQFSWMILFVGCSYLLGCVLNELTVKKWQYELVTASRFIFLLMSLILFGFAALHEFNVAVIIVPMSIIHVCLGVLYPNSLQKGLENFTINPGIACAAMGFFVFFFTGVSGALFSLFSDIKQIHLGVAILLQAILLAYFHPLYEKNKSNA